MKGKARRRAIVEQIRQEGHDACLAGRPVDTNPYSTYSMNRQQWARGYSECEEERRQANIEEVDEEE